MDVCEVNLKRILGNLQKGSTTIRGQFESCTSDVSRKKFGDNY